MLGITNFSMIASSPPPPSGPPPPPPTGPFGISYPNTYSTYSNGVFTNVQAIESTVGFANSLEHNGGGTFVYQNDSGNMLLEWNSINLGAYYTNSSESVNLSYIANPSTGNYISGFDIQITSTQGGPGNVGSISGYIGYPGGGNYSLDTGFLPLDQLSNYITVTLINPIAFATINVTFTFATDSSSDLSSYNNTTSIVMTFPTTPSPPP